MLSHAFKMAAFCGSMSPCFFDLIVFVSKCDDKFLKAGSAGSNSSIRNAATSTSSSSFPSN